MVQKERKASSECAGSLKEWKEAGVDSGAGGDEVEVEVEVEEAGALSVKGPGRRASDGARGRCQRLVAISGPFCHRPINQQIGDSP